MIEAVGLVEEAETFTAETGVDMQFLIAIFEAGRGQTPNEDLAAAYHEELNSPELPVLGDTEEGILEASSFPGSPLPGKCLLSPEMELVECAYGHGNDVMFEALLDHAGE